MHLFLMLIYFCHVSALCGTSKNLPHTAFKNNFQQCTMLCKPGSLLLTLIVPFLHITTTADLFLKNPCNLFYKALTSNDNIFKCQCASQHLNVPPHFPYARVGGSTTMEVVMQCHMTPPLTMSTCSINDKIVHTFQRKVNSAITFLMGAEVLSTCNGDAVLHIPCGEVVAQCCTQPPSTTTSNSTHSTWLVVFSSLFQKLLEKFYFFVWPRTFLESTALDLDSAAILKKILSSGTSSGITEMHIKGSR